MFNKIKKNFNLIFKIVIIAVLSGFFYQFVFFITFYHLQFGLVRQELLDQSFLDSTLQEYEITYALDQVYLDLDYIQSSDEYIDYLDEQYGENDQFESSIEFTGSDSESKEIGRVEALFLHTMLSDPSYYHIGYVNLNGDEFLRVEKDESSGIPYVSDMHKNLSSSSYFSNAIELLEGEAYVSDVLLRRDYDTKEILEPYRPTITIMQSVYFNQRKVGYLEVRTYVDLLISGIVSEANHDVWIVNEEGYYIYHSNPQKTLGDPQNLNTGENLQKDYPEIYESILSEEEGTAQLEDSILAYRKIGQDTGREFVRIEVIPMITIASQTIERIIPFILAQILLSFLVVLLASYAIINTLRPLGQFIPNFKKLGRFEFDKVNLGTADGEIGKMFESFQSMVSTLRDRFVKLNNEIQDAQSELRVVKNDLLIQHDRAQKFFQSVESSQDLIYIMDLDGRISYINPSVIAATGYSPNDVDGKNPFNDLWAKEMNPEFFKKMWQEIQSKRTFKGTIVGKKKNGGEFYANISAIPVLGKDREILYYVVTQTDITEEMHAEDVKSEFITAISHQLRTPLSSTSWLLESVVRNSSISDELKTAIEKALKSNYRVVELVNEMISVTDVEYGKVDIKSENVNIKEVLKEVSDLVIVDDEKRPISIDISSDVPGTFKTSEKYLSRVIQILLQNAVDYSEPTDPIDLKADLKDQNIRFIIRDHGIGIPEEDRSGIFKKFYRASNAISNESNRSGLGLYFAKTVVEAMGGTIGFSSKVDEGSEFWISLPLG